MTADLTKLARKLGETTTGWNWNAENRKLGYLNKGTNRYLGAIGPPADGEKNLEMPILLLQVVQRLEVAWRYVDTKDGDALAKPTIYVFSALIPGVARVMYVFVGVCVGQDHLAGVRLEVRKSVENMAV